jgi:hypothetical protein
MLKAASPPLQANDKWEEVNREGGGREREMMELLNCFVATGSV